MPQVWRNPYRIDNNIRLDLRDSKKRYSTPSQARFYYIFYKDQLVKVGQFPSSASTNLKEEIIAEEINLIYAKEYERQVEPEKDERKDLALELYGDLLQLLSKEDPATFQELISEPVPIEKEIDEDEIEEPFEPERDESEDKELSDLLYEDLLEYLYETDKIAFEEVTDTKLPLKGKTRKSYKQFKQYTIGGSTTKGTAENDFYTFKLDTPINLATKDPQDMIDIVEDYLIHPMKRAFDRRRKGENFFLLSLLYKQNQKDSKGNIIEVPKGITIFRFRARNWKEFYSFVTDPTFGLYASINASYGKYLEASVDNTITTLGFKLEHMYSIE